MGTLPVALALPELTGGELAEVNLLWQQYTAKLPRNLLREQYYDSRNLFKNLGIAIPPEFEQINWVLGWPAKAVDKLSARVRHRGFALPGVKTDTYGVEQTWEDNRMDLGIRQAITSAMIHSVAFLAVTHGDTGRGEPEILISVGSALNSTGIWDARLRALRSALFVTKTDDWGAALDVAIFLPHVTIRSWRTARDTEWITTRLPNPTGRVAVEPLVYKPRLERPFGYSRISRPVMSITDSALRTVARAELSAEFFSAPQRYIMGADEQMFTNDDGTKMTQWEAFIGRIFAAPLTEDADGNSHAPTAGTFAASDPNAQGALLRMFAQQFAGETDVPVWSLGVSQESNPASADAITASREDLVFLAEDTCDTMGAAIDRIQITGAMLRAGKTEVPPKLRRLKSLWRNPMTTTRAAEADAGLKLFTAVPWLRETTVGLEKIGLSADEIERALAERAEAQAAIDAAAPDPAPAPAEVVDESVEDASAA